MAQYRGAIVREFSVVILCKLMRIKVVYEVKAGMFILWYKNTNGLNRWMTRFILKKSNLVLVEGKPYVDFVKQISGKEPFYFPNFVPESEIPSEFNDGREYELLKILFVGYCYEGKGVFHLVRALNEVAKNGIELKLTIAGNESSEFTNFMNHFVLNDNFELERCGQVNHDRILEEFSKSNVFCLPSKHIGEGHNNSINEALMNGICVVCTNHGFLSDIIEDNENGLIINKEDIENEIIERITFLNSNKHLLKQFGEKGYIKLKNNYSTKVLFPILEKHYDSIL